MALHNITSQVLLKSALRLRLFLMALIGKVILINLAGSSVIATTVSQ